MGAGKCSLEALTATGADSFLHLAQEGILSRSGISAAPAARNAHQDRPPPEALPAALLGELPEGEARGGEAAGHFGLMYVKKS